MIPDMIHNWFPSWPLERKVVGVFVELDDQYTEAIQRKE